MKNWYFSKFSKLDGGCKAAQISTKYRAALHRVSVAKMQHLTLLNAKWLTKKS